MRDIAIVSIARTPVGKANKGKLRDTRPDTLAGLVVKEAIKRAKGLAPKDLGDVCLGCAFPEGEQGMNVARIASFLAEIPDEVPAITVNRFCSSGLQAIAVAAGRIALGGIDIGHRRRRGVDEHGAHGRRQALGPPRAAGPLPGGLRLHGHHRRERGQAVRRQPRDPGRVRLQQPHEGRGRDQGRQVQTTRSSR